jgi:hypothetical protein
MDHQMAQAWLDRYVAAWRSYRPGEIGALFTPDIEYRYRPHDEGDVGVDTVVAGWLANHGEPDTWEAEQTPYTVEGNRVVATGYSRYHGDHPDRVYDNCFLLEFDDEGRCRRFTEFFNERT